MSCTRVRIPPEPTLSCFDHTPVDVPDNEERSCRQNALPGPPSQQRYLRNAPQNPHEDEEERGLALARGGSPTLGLFSVMRKSVVVREIVIDTEKDVLCVC